MPTRITGKQKIFLIPGVVLTAICVALIYFYFEAAVRHSTTFIWDSLLNTEDRRLLVIPTCLLLSLIFFGFQHYFDVKSEHQESEGLGSAPSPTLINIVKILGIGFLSLIAGASLGPEAILVPASIAAGSYLGVILFRNNNLASKILGSAGFIALFAAFFHSFWAGMVGLFLLEKQVKVKLSLPIILFAALASFVTVLTLSALSSSAYAALPPSHLHFSMSQVLIMIGLFLGGVTITFLIAASHTIFKKVQKGLAPKPWWAHAIVAASGLSVLYLLGGPLVEFTGNESIVPMLQQAASLGIFGLLWLLVIKVVAISWSKALGYRGGMVFPTIFVASVVVALAQQIDKNISFSIALLIVMAGAIAANQKYKTLF